MEKLTTTEKIYRVLSLVYSCAILNVLFIGGVLAGMGIFGFGPSLIASHQLAKDYYEGKWDRPFRKFVAIYKKEFISANRILLPLTGLIIFYLVDIFLLNQLGWMNNQVIAILFLLISFVILTHLNVTAPIYTFYHLESKRFHRTVFRYSLLNIAPSLLGIAWSILCIGVSLTIPGLIPFFSFGAWIFGIHGIYLQSFVRNEELLASKE